MHAIRNSLNLPLWRLAAGLGLWLALLLGFALLPLRFDIPAVFLALFALAPALLVRLGLSTLTIVQEAVLYQWILRWEFPAACLCLSGLIWDTGWLSGLYVLPWLAICFAIALLGGLRLLRQGFEAWEEVCIHFGLIFVAVGGIWLLISRLGLNPIDFGPAIVFLTAVHFHFAGFAACLIIGLSGRLFVFQDRWVQKLYRAVVWGSILGIPLLALGITFSATLEVLAAGVFAASLLVWSVLILTWGLPQIRSGLAKALLSVASVSILWSMFWALLYAVATYLNLVWVSIPQMGWRHGLFNVLGFALPALLAFALEKPEPRLASKVLPWSQLRGRDFIGPNFFQRIGAVPEQFAPGFAQPTGLIADFASYARPDFEPDLLPLAIQDFYQQTAAYSLRVTPDWQPGFGWVGRLFRMGMDRIGQMALPIQSEQREELIQSQILAIDDSLDGRQGVRAWVRTYQQTQQVAYAAAYSQHLSNGQTYMNIAFPLPGCQMSSILRLDLIPALSYDPALSLSSLPDAAGKLGDQGVYLVFKGLSVRLPINETIRVWTPDQLESWPTEIWPDTTVLAQHDMWICGLLCLRLYYTIYPKKKLSENQVSPAIQVDSSIQQTEPEWYNLA